MVELAKESTTVRRVLDPMLVYFDFRQHWTPERGLAMIILSRMAYFMENSGTIPLITFDNHFSEIDQPVDMLSNFMFYL